MQNMLYESFNFVREALLPLLNRKKLRFLFQNRLQSFGLVLQFFKENMKAIYFSKSYFEHARSFGDHSRVSTWCQRVSEDVQNEFQKSSFFFIFSIFFVHAEKFVACRFSSQTYSQDLWGPTLILIFDLVAGKIIQK